MLCNGGRKLGDGGIIGGGGWWTKVVLFGIGEPDRGRWIDYEWVVSGWCVLVLCCVL